jgi:hypothetical protein
MGRGRRTGRTEEEVIQGYSDRSTLLSFLVIAGYSRCCTNTIGDDIHLGLIVSGYLMPMPGSS